MICYNDKGGTSVLRINTYLRGFIYPKRRNEEVENDYIEYTENIYEEHISLIGHDWFREGRQTSSH